MLKLKSLNALSREAARTARRFPLALTCSIAAGIAAMVLLQNSERELDLVNLAHFGFILALGISLFLSLRLYIEESAAGIKKQNIVQGLGVCFLAVYYFTLPEKFHGKDFYVSGLIMVNLHLLVAIAPFAFQPPRLTAFWQYNRILFERIITALIFSVTLYAGLAGAIASVDHLFHLEIDGKIYGHLWFVLIFGFNTWFFLGGVPENIKGLENDREYPNRLKVYAQYILIPLVCLYIFILYLYTGKIVAQWELPKGWVSSLIIAASLVGILTLLLVWPQREKSENAWIKVYARYFYLALFPLIVLMAVAIGRRVSDYGITVERYFVMLYTLWLFFIAVKFTFNEKTDIRLIPTSLFVIILLVTWGPLSGVTIARKSQMNRLERALSRYDLLDEKGKFRRKDLAGKMPAEDRQEISSIMGYLEKTHGKQVFRPRVTDDVMLKDAPYGKHYGMTSSKIMENYWGLEYQAPYHYRYSGDSYFSLSTAPGENGLNVSGYDYLLDVTLYAHVPEQEFEIQEEKNISFSLSQEQVLDIKIEGSPVMEIMLADVINQLHDQYGPQGYQIPREKMIVEKENERIKIKLVISSFSGQKGKESWVRLTMNARVLIKVK